MQSVHVRARMPEPSPSSDMAATGVAHGQYDAFPGALAHPPAHHTRPVGWWSVNHHERYAPALRRAALRRGAAYGVGNQGMQVHSRANAHNWACSNSHARSHAHPTSSQAGCRVSVPVLLVSSCGCVLCSRPALHIWCISASSWRVAPSAPRRALRPAPAQSHPFRFPHRLHPLCQRHA